MTRSFSFVGTAALILALSSCSLFGDGQEVKVYDPPTGPVATDGAPSHFPRETSCTRYQACLR
jgi:hypothetical protein